MTISALPYSIHAAAMLLMMTVGTESDAADTATCVPTLQVVSHGGLLDHSDPMTPGTIAWHLNRASPCHTLRLLGSSPYVLEKTLTIPSHVALEGLPTPQSVLRAGRGLDGQAMITLNDHTSLRFLVLDGARNALHLVQAGAVSAVRIEDCHLKDTKNTWSGGVGTSFPQPRCHGIVLDGTVDAVIDRNLIERIGSPKVAGASWGGLCSGVVAWGCRNLNVRRNVIRQTLTGGVDLTGSIGAVIADNLFEDTGRNVALWATPDDVQNSGAIYRVADAITAYHNGNGRTYQDIHVLRNQIVNSGNHGIHLSGRDIHIAGNDIRGVRAQGILVCDHIAEDPQQPPDCSSRVIIEWNTVTGLHPGRHEVELGRYNTKTVLVRHNEPTNHITNAAGHVPCE